MTYKLKFTLEPYSEFNRRFAKIIIFMKFERTVQVHIEAYKFNESTNPTEISNQTENERRERKNKNGNTQKI